MSTFAPANLYGTRKGNADKHVPSELLPKKCRSPAEAELDSECMKTAKILPPDPANLVPHNTVAKTYSKKKATGAAKLSADPAPPPAVVAVKPTHRNVPEKITRAKIDMLAQHLKIAPQSKNPKTPQAPGRGKENVPPGVPMTIRDNPEQDCEMHDVSMDDTLVGKPSGDEEEAKEDIDVDLDRGEEEEDFLIQPEKTSDSVSGKTVAVESHTTAQGNVGITVEVELWHCDPVNCVRELVGNPVFRDAIRYSPEKLYKDAEGKSEIWNEMWTWKTQVQQ
ncbi:hypothetical protein EW026_g8225 [Hermanssonia centrifuga]|uniref:Uncharacterized protein n=1 Tax=Hermanssonia centrifuga TaxID=98765 RepID=A0A4S4K4X3_9APHY|nr:hypothetical protein EW026_g8225 [Hermanssonia centrifuga]